jgi:hypothetical protein
MPPETDAGLAGAPDPAGHGHVDGPRPRAHPATCSANLSGRRSYEVFDPLLCTLAMLHQLGCVFGTVNVSHRLDGLVGEFDQPGFVGQELDAISRPQRQRTETSLLNLGRLRKGMDEFSVTVQPV